MKLGDVASKLSISQKKLTAYALNHDHPKGKHKAIIFEAILGYNVENFAPLVTQIMANALESEAILKRTDQYGQHFQVNLLIVGISGQKAMVRTGWFLASGSTTASLSTLFVIGMKTHD
ncbi:MAG: hypothetical protein GWP17_03880 [Aquificales bacterium]|nr:hypothetical protein [Aquificales bacterium]